jgi:hypothetical protein
MKYLKLFEEFSESGFAHDFNFTFGENDDFYVETNLADRIVRIELPPDAQNDQGAGGAWYDPKTELRLLVQGQNDPLIELINGYLDDCYHNHTIPAKILLDDREDAVEVNDNTFTMPIKVNGESYDSWIIKTKRPRWSSRVGKKYGL